MCLINMLCIPTHLRLSTMRLAVKVGAAKNDIRTNNTEQWDGPPPAVVLLFLGGNGTLVPAAGTAKHDDDGGDDDDNYRLTQLV